jgi:hypothetical protein
LLHYHFAKLHLYSHVFRGLQDTTVPSYFLDSASSATTAAIAIINALIHDPELQPALIGVPSYMHSMTAFAAMFLSKLTMTYGDQFIERSLTIDLISRLISLYRSTSAGKYHLVSMMANGLEKIIKTLQETSNHLYTHKYPDATPMGIDTNTFAEFGDLGFHGDSSVFDANFLMDFNMNPGASAMHLGEGPTAFETTDLSPSFL